MHGHQSVPLHSLTHSLKHNTLFMAVSISYFNFFSSSSSNRLLYVDEKKEEIPLNIAKRRRRRRWRRQRPQRKEYSFEANNVLCLSSGRKMTILFVQNLCAVPATQPLPPQMPFTNPRLCLDLSFSYHSFASISFI